MASLNTKKIFYLIANSESKLNTAYIQDNTADKFYVRVSEGSRLWQPGSEEKWQMTVLAMTCKIDYTSQNFQQTKGKPVYLMCSGVKDTQVYNSYQPVCQIFHFNNKKRTTQVFLNSVPATMIYFDMKEFASPTDLLCFYFTDNLFRRIEFLTETTELVLHFREV